MGPNTTAPFDPNYTYPSFTMAVSGTPSGTATTANPQDAILGLEGDQDVVTQTAGSGFILIGYNGTGQDISGEYQIETTQTSLPVPFSASVSFPYVMFVDALTHGDGVGGVTPSSATTNNNVCCVNTQYASSSNFLSTVTSTSLTTTSKTTTSKTTTTFTRQYPFIDDVVIDIPQKEEYNEGHNFIVDNSGAGGSAQLTQYRFHLSEFSDAVSSTTSRTFHSRSVQRVEWIRLSTCQ